MFFSWVGRESSPISRHSDRDGIRPGQGEVLVGELTGQGIIATKAAMPALDPLGSHASRTPVRVRSPPRWAEPDQRRLVCHRGDVVGRGCHGGERWRRSACGATRTLMLSFNSRVPER